MRVIFFRSTFAVLVGTLFVAAAASASAQGGGGRTPMPRSGPPRFSGLPDTLPTAPGRDSAFWNMPADSVRQWVSVEIQRVLFEQRRAWQLDERRAHQTQRVNENPEPAALRAARVHCHTEDINTNNRWSRFWIRNVISSTISRMSLCPDWIPPDNDPRREPTHEYRGEVVEAARLYPFPVGLIALLDSARTQFPGEQWFVDQSVRVLTENRDFAAAQRAVQSCGSSAWCAMLGAYVTQASGNLVAADSMYQRALSLVPDTTRCRWVDVELLLAPADAGAYRKLDCAAKTLHANTFWWLATPLLSQPGNARRVEHYSRSVRNVLVNALPLDAVHDLRADRGVDAITIVRQRYGWADHIAWGDDLVEVEHDNYLGPFAAHPYSAPEYVTARSSTVPSARAVAAPFSLTDDDFDLYPQRGNIYDWWPQEHYRPVGGAIVPFIMPQHVLLRRDGKAQLIMAGLVANGALQAVRGRTLRAYLALSESAAHRTNVGNTQVRGGERVALATEISRPAIAALEVIAGTDQIAAARSRIGIDTIPTLGEVAGGRCAISRPILVSDGMQVSGGTRALQDNMLGTVALDNPTRVGVSWESYGFEPGDSLTVSIRVERRVELGRMRRAGIRLGVAGNPRGSVRVTWREPDPARAGHTVSGVGVPIVLRNINVDLSRLQEGDYAIDIVMQRRGCEAVSTARELMIWR